MSIVPLCANAADVSDCIQPVDTRIDGQLLTKKEELAILNQRFFDDLARFEECLRTSSNAGGGASADGGGGSAGGGQSGGSETFAAAESVAATGIQGTELPESVEIPQVETAPAGQFEPANAGTAPPSGKLPEKMEIVDNDDRLLEQIRQAAIAEENPAMKEKLWQEYNKRKSGGGGSFIPGVGGQ